MPDAALLAGLLVPVALLLFLNLRMSKRIRYPHDLLRSEARKGAAAFLFRSFRTYHDVILDAAIALVLAFAIAATAGGSAGPAVASRPALVVDCSRSMLSGPPGRRPIDLALKAAYPAEDGDAGQDARAGRAPERFALAFDPARGATRLYPLDRLLDRTTGEAAVTRLASELCFHEVDYRALGDLGRRHRGGITLLTDSLEATPEGFEARESGFAEGFSAYPTAARYDRAAGNWLVAFATAGRPLAVDAARWDSASGGFLSLPARQLVREERQGGIALRLPSEGLWRVALSGRAGEADAVFGFRLRTDSRGAAASGDLSSRVLAALPYLEPSPSPSVTLADRRDKGVPGAALATGPRMVRIVTTLSGADGGAYLPPRVSGGRLVSGSGLVAGGRADLGLGPAGLANEDLPLVYDGILDSLDAPAWLGTKAAAGPLRKVAGLLFASAGGDAAAFAGNAMPVNAGAAEYFPPLRSGKVTIPRAEGARWPWALALALLLALKFALWKRATGKSLFRKGGS